MLTSGRSPVLLLDGKRGTDPSRDLSTVVKQILYSCRGKEIKRKLKYKTCNIRYKGLFEQLTSLGNKKKIEPSNLPSSSHCSKSSGNAPPFKRKKGRGGEGRGGNMSEGTRKMY